jgi:alkaline phosphatase
MIMILYYITHYVYTGKSTGVVSTARITHATPAATYAHAADRNWEADSNLDPILHKDCTDIASQLINDNHDIQVWNLLVPWPVPQ